VGVGGNPHRDAWVNRKPVGYRYLLLMIAGVVETDETATDETGFLMVRACVVLDVVANGSTYRRTRRSFS